MSETAPVRAEDFATLADRREWLAGLPDVRVRIATTPTKKRLLAANDNRRLDALEAADALLAPHVAECMPDTIEAMDKAAVGAGWRMRPSVDEIERAMKTGRVAARTAKGRTHAERWRYRTWHIGPLVFTTTRRTERGPVLIMNEVVMGDIRVPAGAMIEREQTSRGKPLKPSEYRTYEKAEPKAKRSARRVREYLDLGGTWGNYESWAGRLLGEPRPLEQPAAAMELATAYGNTPVLPPVTYLPTSNGDPDCFIGGVSYMSGNGSGHSNHAKRVQDEAVRILVQKWLAEHLGGDDVRILSLATSSATAAEAGADMGMTRQRYVQVASDVLDRVAVLLAA